MIDAMHEPAESASFAISNQVRRAMEAMESKFADMTAKIERFEARLTTLESIVH